jgi:hypothetical protein
MEDPFGERYTQQWPATPFGVRVTNVTYPGSAKAMVYVDGQLACRKTVHKKEAFLFRG